jgi:hypothetical protein
MKLIKETIKASSEIVVHVAVFFVLMYAGMCLFPYILTYESYSKSSHISDHFRIAVIKDSKPALINWMEYSDKRSFYQDKLISESFPKLFEFNEIEGFNIKKSKDNTFQLTLHTDDYIYWSRYAIEQGTVKPISFHFNGAFGIMWAFPAAFLGTFLLSCAYKRCTNPKRT